jgi:hypothetical protein
MRRIRREGELRGIKFIAVAPYVFQAEMFAFTSLPSVGTVECKNA